MISLSNKLVVTLVRINSLTMEAKIELGIFKSNMKILFDVFIIATVSIRVTKNESSVKKNFVLFKGGNY